MPTERDAGLAALKINDLPTAVAALERAVLADPGDSDAYGYLASAYFQIGRHAEAVNAFAMAANLQPANPKAHANLGIALEKTGQRDQAAYAYGQALALSPGYAVAQQGMQRLQALSQQGYPPAASAPLNPPAAAPTYGGPLNAPPAQEPMEYGLASPNFAPPAPSAPPPPAGLAAGYGLGSPNYAPTRAGGLPNLPSQPAPTMYGRPLQSQEQEPVPEKDGMALGLAMLILTGIAAATGLALGFLCVAAGGRIPFLSIIIGVIVGKSVEYFAGNSEMAGPMAALFAFGAAGINLLVITHFGYELTPYAYIFPVFAIAWAYRIVSN